MKIRTTMARIMVAALTAAGSGLAAQETDLRPAVAVMPFTDGGSIGEEPQNLTALTVGLQQMLLTELSQSSDLRIVERSILREVLQEQDLASSGRADAQTAARVGRIVGARYMITGVFVDLSGTFRMDARVIDAETTEILKAERIMDDRDQMFDMLVRLAGAIIEDIDLPELPREVRNERQEIPMTPEAIVLYSNAQLYLDQGDRERAIELYQRFTERFPEYVEAGEELRQLTSG